MAEATASVDTEDLHQMAETVIMSAARGGGAAFARDAADSSRVPGMGTCICARKEDCDKIRNQKDR